MNIPHTCIPTILQMNQTVIELVPIGSFGLEGAFENPSWC